MDNFDRQLNLEREMSGLGHQRVVVDVIEGKDQLNPGFKPHLPESDTNKRERHKASAREAEQEGRTEYGRKLIAFAIETVGLAIHKFIESKGAGNRTNVKAILRKFYPLQPTLLVKDGESVAKGEARLSSALVKWEQAKYHETRVIAFIAVQSIINSLYTKKRHTQAAGLIGRSLEDELRFRYFAASNPDLYDKVFGDVSTREGNLKRRRAILIHSMNKDDKGLASNWVKWADEETSIAGAKCIELIEASTDLVRTKIIRKGRNKTVGIIEATQSTMDFVMDRINTSGARLPVFLPAVCPPKEWVGPHSGGYYSAFNELRPVRMVKVRDSKVGRAYLTRLQEHSTKMPLVYRAINAVQGTPWKINKPVLAVLKEAWEHGGIKIGQMPVRTDATTLDSTFPLAPYHPSLGNNPEKYTAWKRARSKVYDARVEQCSRVIQMTGIIAMAEKFFNEEEIFFPTQLDFRGRMYALPSYLNPQGTDVAKGLLAFARGCKLGVSGWKWLHIHIANMHGEDKISLEAREQWTVENYSWIAACVHNPFEHRDWMNADKGDKAWQFLAAAMELVAAVESGDYENFISHLPVTVDGTCNGLQHFSAMLLDQDGANSVNLQPSEVPSDIYQIVADKVKAKFATMDDPLAKQWLDWGFDRKATKRSVMILPYSGTRHASKDYVLEYMQKREDCPFEHRFKAATFFSTHVWTTIEETIASAGIAMKWLRQVAKEVTAAEKTLKWATPLNFLVEQDNRDPDQYRIDLKLGTRIRYSPLMEKASERLDKDAQMLGVSPNFVHSLDAACLMLTVNRAVDEGIHDFAMVHDSYGVLAGKMDTLYMGLRQAFVDIYQTDVMGDFLKTTTAGLPEEVYQKLKDAMPKKGTFQIELVKDSKYFFA